MYSPKMKMKHPKANFALFVNILFSFYFLFHFYIYIYSSYPVHKRVYMWVQVATSLQKTPLDKELMKQTNFLSNTGTIEFNFGNLAL